jgi:hypothetical protein
MTKLALGLGEFLFCYVHFIYLIPSIPLCYDDYFINMTVKHINLLNPIMGIMKCTCWLHCCGTVMACKYSYVGC